MYSLQRISTATGEVLSVRRRTVDFASLATSLVAIAGSGCGCVVLALCASWMHGTTTGHGQPNDPAIEMFLILLSFSLLLHILHGVANGCFQLRLSSSWIEQHWLGRRQAIKVEEVERIEWRPVAPQTIIVHGGGCRITIEQPTPEIFSYFHDTFPAHAQVNRPKSFAAFQKAVYPAESRWLGFACAAALFLTAGGSLLLWWEGIAQFGLIAGLGCFLAGVLYEWRSFRWLPREGRLKSERNMVPGKRRLEKQYLS